MSQMTTEIKCKMVHHGAAASLSPHCLLWLPSHAIAYASHGILNICTNKRVVVGTDSVEQVWTVTHTLCSRVASGAIITSLSLVHGNSILVGFSNGNVTCWHFHESSKDWTEQPFLATNDGRSITNLDGHFFEHDEQWVVLTCSSNGISMITVDCKNGTSTPTVTHVSSHVSNVVNCHVMPPPLNQLVVLIGTAAPRHNKIQVYMLGNDYVLQHIGHLTGHQDWITCLAWNQSSTTCASGSQDCKIRLWNFTTTIMEQQEAIQSILVNDNDDDSNSSTDDDDDLVDMDDDEEQGEARLEIAHSKGVTRVTLEALLFGHEEAVTAVCWHPNPMPLYQQEEILISSSMDRTILIWSSITGIWTPLTRVGSAGGILGGSIGSTLLGFVNVAVEPENGTSLVGHAYGGAIHVWNMEQDDIEEEELSLEDIAMRIKWKAMPCITGHFGGVTDLCWEAERGDYLLTVSADQTCRLWGPVPTQDGSGSVWLELARPQVHGYDLAAVVSVSSSQHPHLCVSGADEKEARVFDAPVSTVRLLDAVYGIESSEKDVSISRVERAYIPSLGLSQKASAADGAEIDTSETDVVSVKKESHLHLPLERDLGVISLWPEVRKLFGHNTELYCLASTVSARSGPKFESSPYANDVFVASSTKARDVDDAAIRLWDAEKGKCLQILSGGHRSTVAALCFSPDGRFLASSGKDRRLCLWFRDVRNGTEQPFALASAIDSAHKRIVWGLHFCPFDPSLLASGSRDGCVKLWKAYIPQHESETNPTLTEVSLFEPSSRKDTKAESVTSLAFAPKSFTFEDGDAAILAIGLECGFIELWSLPTVDFGERKCRLVTCLPPGCSHVATVSKLAWQPLRNDDVTPPEESSTLTLASCSLDHGCRVFEVEF